jgi:hypothetical protein
MGGKQIDDLKAAGWRNPGGSAHAWKALRSQGRRAVRRLCEPVQSISMELSEHPVVNEDARAAARGETPSSGFPCRDILASKGR